VVVVFGDLPLPSSVFLFRFGVVLVTLPVLVLPLGFFVGLLSSKVTLVRFLLGRGDGVGMIDGLLY